MSTRVQSEGGQRGVARMHLIFIPYTATNGSRRPYLVIAIAVERVRIPVLDGAQKVDPLYDQKVVSEDSKYLVGAQFTPTSILTLGNMSLEPCA